MDYCNYKYRLNLYPIRNYVLQLYYLVFSSSRKWNIGVDDGDKSGYIAQDIIKIGFPHLVGGIPNDTVNKETDNDGYTSPDKVQLSMNYNQVVPLLDAALKNALERIEKLEAKIMELQAKIMELQANKLS